MGLAGCGDKGVSSSTSSRKNRRFVVEDDPPLEMSDRKVSVPQRSRTKIALVTHAIGMVDERIYFVVKRIVMWKAMRTGGVCSRWDDSTRRALRASRGRRISAGDR